MIVVVYSQTQRPLNDRDLRVPIKVAVKVKGHGAGFWTDYFLDEPLHNADLFSAQLSVRVLVELVEFPLNHSFSVKKIFF